MKDFMSLVCDTLQAATPLPIHNERALQASVQACLDEAGFQVTREARLGPRSRIDYLVRPTGASDFEFVGIECKLNNVPRDAVARQVQRYARTSFIYGIILVTQRAISPPELWDGKPFIQMRPTGVGGIA